MDCSILQNKGDTYQVDSGQQITQYLEELAQELTALQVTIPFHMLIAGGAYMLLQEKRESTEDIDFALIENPPTKLSQNEVFQILIKKAEVARKGSAVPYATEFKRAVEMVAHKHESLLDDWMNDESAVYYYDDAPQAEVTFWRAFGTTLYVYLPTLEYIFATKIAAYRPKDAHDIQILIQELQLHAREQAKVIVDKFLIPEAQEFWEVEKKLKRLFR